MAIPIMEKIAALRAKGFDVLKKLSRREQAMVAVAVVALLISAIYMIYEPVSDAFDKQQLALVEAQNKTKTVAGTIERYMKLKTRRDAIESRYREVEFKEGALSHLETLIRTKAMVSSGFTIKDSPARSFGGTYQQLPFSVRFQTSNLSTLISFLNEIVHGTRPLILGKVDLQRSRNGDRLEVDLDVSSLKKTGA